MADDKAPGLKGWLDANKRLVGLFMMVGAVMAVAGFGMKLGLSAGEFLFKMGPMLIAFGLGFHIVLDSARERREKRDTDDRKE